MRIVPAPAVNPVAEYIKARAELEAKQAEVAELAEALIKQMETDQRKSYRQRIGDQNYSLTYTRASSTLIDEPGLRKALGAKSFDKYTLRILDRKAMEAAMDQGEVDPVTVSKYVRVTHGRTYLRLSSRPLDAPESETA